MPNSLYKLIFGFNFNQEIKNNVLPNSLHTLTIGFSYNQEIKENILPKSIKKISLYSDCDLINYLPLWIEEVYIKFHGNDNYNKEVNNLSITLEKIIIENEKFLTYITKIPFGCNTIIQKIDA